MTKRHRVTIVVVLLGGALVAWLVTVERMSGMDAGPGTDLGGFGWYLGVWMTMTAAMMLPAVVPMVLAFSRLARERSRRGRPFVPTWVFVFGYLLAWAVYGVAAYAAYRLIRALDLDVLAWGRRRAVDRRRRRRGRGTLPADAAEDRVPEPLPDAPALRRPRMA